MNKIIIRAMSMVLLLALTFGGYGNVGALSESLAPGITYYVSTNGVDTNTGTETAPWRTIQKAVNSVNPGDTILVRAGTYNESITISRSGSADGVIKLTNYPGETVQINGGSNMALYSRGAVGYWTIEGLRFASSNQHALQFGWFHSAVTHHITLRNNYVNGAIFTVGNNQLFEGNEISGVGYTASGGYGGINDSHGGLGDDATHHNIYRSNYIHDFTNYNARGIWVQGRAHDNIVEFNRIENIWTTGLGQCIDLDAGQTGLVQWRHIVRNNTVKDCSYVGIQLENIFDSLVENNQIMAEKGGSAGIIVINYSTSVGCGVGGENNQYGDTNGDNNCKGDITNNIVRQNVVTKRGSWGWGYGGLVNWGAGGVKILGNTFYASGASGNASINFQAPAAETSQSVIQNNIFYNANGPAVCAVSFDSFTLDSNNLLYKTNSDSVYGSGSSCRETYSLTGYQAATGKGQNSVQAEPQFASQADYNLHLRDTSPAIDRGTNLGVSADIEGSARPQGNAVDIGAYEALGVIPAATTPVATATPTVASTQIPPTPTLEPAFTATPIPPTNTPEPTITATPIPPTFTSTPAQTYIPPTNTPEPTMTATPIPPTSTMAPTSVPQTPLPGSEVIYDDRDSAFVYSAGWENKDMQDTYKGTLKLTTTKDSSVTFNFTGQSFSIVYRGGPNYGKMLVYVDGVQVGTLDQMLADYASQKRWDYTGQFASGPHTLKLVFVNVKYAPGSLDAVIVRSPSTVPSETPFTATPIPQTNTPEPTMTPTTALPTNTPESTFTATPIPPTNTPAPTFTATPIPPTNTPAPTMTPTPVPPATKPGLEVIYDDRDSAFVYSAGWENKNMQDAYKGTLKLTTKKDSAVTLNFTGQSFSIVYRGGPNYGKMLVYVDGVQVGTLDQKLAKYASQKRWNYTGQLASGPHTLKLVFVNVKYAPGSLDAVIVR
ncbi:MAG: right-handed parallel beta-helix repeat-containing protein [Chloroflexi bacterium]|nr:right-handed parallel beta-helix repeat-containing protein [Chloroflexota bacterium]